MKEENKTSRGTILIIEDEVMLVQVIQKKLQLSGYEVITATTGKQAIGYLEDLAEAPSAIWLDYYLGDMSGLEFLSVMKEKEKWKDVPVIVVSNSATDEKIHSMLALGADKYVLKAEHRIDEIVKMFDDFLSNNN